MKSSKKIKSAKDIVASPGGKIFTFNKIYKAREVSKEELDARKIKKPSPSALKRQAEAKKARQKAEQMPPAMKAALKKFGVRAEVVSESHSKYYTARAAQVLLKAGVTKDIISAPGKRKDVPQTIAVTPLKKGWYAVMKDGVTLPRRYRWKEVFKMQLKANRKKKIQMIAARVGSTPALVEKMLRQIVAEERVTVRRFKRTKEYKGYSGKKKRTITVKRRTAAILNAMTDLLEIHGSPRAVAERDNPSAEWRKHEGKWIVKEGKVWLEKLGPNHWRRVYLRKPNKKKKQTKRRKK